MDAEGLLLMSRWKGCLPPWRGSFLFDPNASRYLMAGSITDQQTLACIGARLKAAKTRLGLSVDRLAKASGTSRHTVQRLLARQTRKVTPDVLRRLAQAVGTTADDLTSEG